MVVMLAKPMVETTHVKSTVESSLDLWVRFCAAVDEGRGIANASAAGGVAATVARQLRYVSFFSFF
jgi:hypothetical protein